MELDRTIAPFCRAAAAGRPHHNTLARREGVCPKSACLRRVRALEESGLIQGYTALIDQPRRASR